MRQTIARSGLVSRQDNELLSTVQLLLQALVLGLERRSLMAMSPQSWGYSVAPRSVTPSCV